jgi:hypothetical protein
MAKKKTEKPAAKTVTKKPKKAKKLNKGELLTEAAELLGRIEAAEVACQERQLEVNDARENYKASKQSYGAAVDELRKLSRARKEKMPLFDAAGKKKSDTATTADGANSVTPPAGTNGHTDDTWKAAGLSAAAFADNHQDALEAAGLRTLGDLQAKMNQHGQWWSKEIGVNGRFRVPIEDAFNRYLTEICPPSIPDKSVAPQPATDKDQPVPAEQPATAS